MQWVAEYSPSNDNRGNYPWHIISLNEHVQENLRALIKGESFLDWRIIAGPFESNKDAGKYLDELRSRIGWK